MMIFLHNAAVFALVMIEISLIVFFLYKTIGINPKFKIFHLIPMILILTILLIIPTLIWYEAPWHPIWGLGLGTFAALIFFGGNIRERLLYFLIVIILSSFIDIVGESVVIFFFWQASLLPNPALFQVIFLSVVTIIKSLVLGSMLHISKKGKLYLPGNYWVLAIVSFSLILVVNFILIVSEQQYRLITALGLMSFWLVLYFAFYFVCRYFSIVNEANLMAIQNEMIEKYMLQKQTSDQMIKVLSHDLRHNLGRLKALADQGGDEQTAQSLAEYDKLLAQNRMLDVGNDIANAILNEKRLVAQRDNITFMVSGSFFEGLTLAQIDFCSLLGNLLDNALEAAVQVEDTALRMVELRINRKGHQLLLSLENGYATEPQFKDNAFITRKKSRGLHGIGTVSINNIVDKYDGVIQNTYQNNRFKSSLMLRCYD